MRCGICGAPGAGSRALATAFCVVAAAVHLGGVLYADAYRVEGCLVTVTAQDKDPLGFGANVQHALLLRTQADVTALGAAVRAAGCDGRWTIAGGGLWIYRKVGDADPVVSLEPLLDLGAIDGKDSYYGYTLIVYSQRRLRSLAPLRNVRGTFPGALYIRTNNILESLVGLEGIAGAGKDKYDVAVSVLENDQLCQSQADAGRLAQLVAVSGGSIEISSGTSGHSTVVCTWCPDDALCNNGAAGASNHCFSASGSGTAGCLPDVSTDAPSKAPTAPTNAPTDAPSSSPSVSPTAEPTDAPSDAPTDAPSKAPTPPTAAPTEVPTPWPTASPSNSPTAPSSAPTASPTPTWCVDNKQNGRETSVDCGGGECPPCRAGKKCAEGPRDCLSGLCKAGGTCDTAAPTRAPTRAPTKAADCRFHARCVEEGIERGLCCPSSAGTFLFCCDNTARPSPAAPTPTPTPAPVFLGFLKGADGAVAIVFGLLVVALLALLVRVRVCLADPWAPAVVTAGALAGVLVAAADFVTDLLALEELRAGSALRTAGVATIAASVFLNSAATGYVLRYRQPGEEIDKDVLKRIGLVVPLVVLLACTNVGTLQLVPWRRRVYGGYPSARLNFGSLLSLFTENIPQIVIQVLNARGAPGGLAGVALLSVVVSAAAIVVRTLDKLFVFIAAGGNDWGSTRARSSTNLENSRLREEVEQLRSAASSAALGRTPSASDSAASVLNPMAVELRERQKAAPAAAAAAAAAPSPSPSRVRSATGLHPFTATNQGEVTIAPGDVLDVLCADTGNGWAVIRNKSRGENKEGRVPASYVTIA